MILSPYHNPPYRTPLSKSATSPPPSHSPKRKRTNSERTPTPLQVNTTESHDFALDTGADSPRTKVAASFQDLSLRPPESTRVAIPRHEHMGAPRKRLRCSQPLLRNTPDYGLDADVGADLLSTPKPCNKLAIHSRSASPLEIDETPNCRSRIPSSPPFSPDRSKGAQWTWNAWTEDGSEEARRKQLPSSQAPTPQTSPLQNRDDTVERTFSPMEPTDDMAFDQFALTWQDSEITGHDIDSTSPDDDGLGINGIGFKPTPAMAYARSQKRKQQVNEWRAREAREARQRRFERRRGASVSGPGRNSSAKRSVRFQDVG
ncbi:hypothetical protein LTR08_001647 [Meristemomyces frigidus]|nr:hypothetical protein LTR08_001647 [Meristemomyces frigidus]